MFVIQLLIACHSIDHLQHNLVGWQGIMSDNMTEPHQLLPLEGFEQRLLGIHQRGDYVVDEVVHFLLPVGDTNEFPKPLCFKCLYLPLWFHEQGLHLAATQHEDKRLVKPEFIIPNLAEPHYRHCCCHNLKTTTIFWLHLLQMHSIWISALVDLMVLTMTLLISILSAHAGSDLVIEVM